MMRNKQTMYRPHETKDVSVGITTQATYTVVDHHPQGLRLMTDHDVWFSLNGPPGTPVAGLTNDGCHLVPGIPEYFSVQEGDTVYFLGGAAAAIVNVTEIQQ